MKPKKKFNIFMIILFVLAASPLAILGHEVTHLIVGYIYGGKPVALCVNFDGQSFASALVDYNRTVVYTCQMNSISEYIAFIVTIIITLVCILVFTKKYIKLIEEVNRSEEG